MTNEAARRFSAIIMIQRVPSCVVSHGPVFSCLKHGLSPPHAFGLRITDVNFRGRTRLFAFFDPGRGRCVVESLDFCTGLCHKGPDLWLKECARCATRVSNVFCFPSLVTQNGSSDSFQRKDSELGNGGS